MGERFDRIVKGGLVVVPGGVRALDIGIKDGRIAALAERLAEAEGANSGAGARAGTGVDAGVEVIDASGLWVLPGMVDAHVHFNEPGMGHWEGFATGSAALAAGGCTTYVDMPLNGLPPTVDAPALRLKAELAAGRSAVDYAFWGGLVPGNADRLAELHEEGVAAFKAFLSDPGGDAEERFREVDDVTLLEGMERIAGFGGLLALHAESEAITSKLAAEAAREGRAAPLDIARTRPVIAELEAIGRALLFAETTGCRLHIVHVSSPEGIELIDRAKARGVDVTSETCPHYLTLTEDDLGRLGALAKCAPPVRDEARAERMWRQLAEGKIDVVASDHSPCPPELKLGPGRTYADAWGGIAGAQSSLELLLHEGHAKRGIPLPTLAEALSTGPAKRFGLYPRKGAIEVGCDADLALVDPNAAYTLAAGDLLQRHKISPYVGRTFSCRVAATLVRGDLVYRRGAGIVREGRGEWIRSESKGRVTT